MVRYVAMPNDVRDEIMVAAHLIDQVLPSGIKDTFDVRGQSIMQKEEKVHKQLNTQNVPCSLSLPPPPHTHARARAHTHTHIRTHAHARTHTHTHTHTHIHTLTHARTHARTHTHTHRDTHTHTVDDRGYLGASRITRFPSFPVSTDPCRSD